MKRVQWEKTDQQEYCMKLNSMPNVYARVCDVNAIPVKGGKAFKKNPMKGFPDIICCLLGRFVVIECKRKGNKRSIEQTEFKQGIEKSGGVYITAYSWDDISKELNERLKEWYN
jgi:hypothetical protein